MRTILLLCLLSMISPGYAQQARPKELPEVFFIPPAAGKYVWEKAAQLKGRILFNNTIACSDSVVYSFGGFDTLRVQREMNRLVGRKLIRDSLRYPGRGFMNNVFFIRDSVMYLGGGHDSGKSRYAWNDFWEYHFQSGQWTKLKDLPFYYSHAPFVFGTGERVIVLVSRLQGEGFRAAMPVFYEYIRAEDSWKIISKELSPSDILLPPEFKEIAGSLQPTAFKVDEDIFVLFQNTCSFKDNCSTTFFKFSLRNHEWTRLPSFPGRIQTFAFALGDDSYGYIGGGVGRTFGNSSQVFRYDTQKGKWERITDMPRGVRYAKGWRFKGESYVGFGINDRFNTVVVWKMKQKK